ncbi:MAG: mechanosensitive ion channel family protein [Planctomycetia bacterium]|nr:mechanosensitive ion channel family protein [Planctomycetia bacterium]
MQKYKWVFLLLLLLLVPGQTGIITQAPGQEVPDNLTNMSKSPALPAKASVPDSHPVPMQPAPAPAKNTQSTEEEPVQQERAEQESHAADAPAPATAPAPPEAAPLSEHAEKLLTERRKHLRTPRKLFDYLVQCFTLNEYLRASIAFDLVDYEEMSEYEKKFLAYYVMIVLSRITLVDLDTIPDDDSMEEYTYQPNLNCPPLVLKKMDGFYLMTEQSVLEFAKQYDDVKELPPYVNTSTYPIQWQDWWFKKQLGLSYIQWLTLFVSIILGMIAGKVSAKLLYLVTLAPFHLLQRDPLAYHISRHTWRPMGWLITYMVWYAGILAIKPPPLIAEAVGWPLHFLVLAMSMMTAFRLTDVVSEILRARVKKHYTKIDEILVPLFRRSLKVIVGCAAVIVAIQMMGFSAIGVISGMGIGGIAIALAAQNTIANFFGSLTVLMDRPFVIGDWILTGNVEGEVESVGMRSTRIRTFYNSLVTVPNNFLTTAVIDNMGRRQFRRYKTLIQVTYETPPDKIEAFCEGIRELIVSYPNTRKDLFHVWVSEFGASSIDILLICFFLVPDSAAEYRARSTFILDILRLAEKMNVNFAYPTQTIYPQPVPTAAAIDEDVNIDGELAITLADDIVEARKQKQDQKTQQRP